MVDQVYPRHGISSLIGRRKKKKNYTSSNLSAKCGSQLAVCLVSLLVSVCRSCVSSSSVQRPPIPRWCPVRASLSLELAVLHLPT